MAKPRNALPHLSEKRRAALKGKRVWSTIKKKKRKPSEFARIYGSKERVEFVKSLPCAACGVVGYSENAHLLGNDGMSRKAGYETIGPLCGQRDVWKYKWGQDYYIGCHSTYDNYRGNFDARFPDFDPEIVAAETEKLWLSYIADSGRGD